MQKRAISVFLVISFVVVFLIIPSFAIDEFTNANLYVATTIPYAETTPVIASWIVSQPFLIPKSSLPASVSFEAKFENAGVLTSTSGLFFKIFLGNQLLTVNSVYYNSSSTLFDVTTTFPSNISAGKYILKLNYCGLDSLNFKGVEVYDSSQNFTFIHLTDVHFNPPTIGSENILNHTMLMINQSNPDFVIMTGDFITGSTNIEIDLQRFYQILYSYNFATPIFFVNGNHEKESLTGLQDAVLYLGSNLTRFDSYENPYEYPISFDYNDYHFIGLDSSCYPYQSLGNISDVQYTWLHNELANNSNKKLVVFNHQSIVPINWVNSSIAQNVNNLFSKYSVQAMFSGHIHKSVITNSSNVLYFVTTSAINDTHWETTPLYPSAGYRIIQIINDKISTAYITNTFSYQTGELIGGGFPDYPTGKNGTISFIPQDPYSNIFDNAARIDSFNSTWGGFWFIGGYGLYAQNCKIVINNFMTNNILNVSFSSSGLLKIYNPFGQPIVFGAESIWQDNVTTIYASKPSTIIVSYSNSSDLFNQVYAQVPTYSIETTILNSNSLVGNANVTIDENLQGFTNDQGKIQFNLTGGNHSIKILVSGTLVYTGNFAVQNSGSMNIDLKTLTAPTPTFPPQISVSDSTIAPSKIIIPSSPTQSPFNSIKTTTNQTQPYSISPSRNLSNNPPLMFTNNLVIGFIFAAIIFTFFGIYVIAKRKKNRSSRILENP